jgi:hypothetical protein
LLEIILKDRYIWRLSKKTKFVHPKKAFIRD